MMELIEHSLIDAMISERNSTIENLRKGFEYIAISNYQADINISNGVLGYREYNKINCELRIIAITKDNLEECILFATKKTDAVKWNELFEKSKLKAIMSYSKYSDWQENIKKCNVPEFNKENVLNTFQSLFYNTQGIFEETILEIFKSISWCFVSNLPHKFGKIIRFDNFARVTHTEIKNYVTILPRYEFALMNLNKAFLVFDSKESQEDSEEYLKRLKLMLERHLVYEDEYFEVKIFLKGSGKIKFKRLDLVDKLNLVIARHYENCLPAPK